MKNENKIISGPTFVSLAMVPDACATPVIDRKKRRGRCCKTSLSSLECFSFSSSLLGSSATLCARTGFFLTKMGEKGVKIFNKLGETQGETPGEGSENREFAGGEKRRHPRICFP